MARLGDGWLDGGWIGDGCGGWVANRLRDGLAEALWLIW
jgi:hypothetical protein